MENEIVYGKSVVLSVLESSRKIKKICIQRSFNDDKTMKLIKSKGLRYEVVDKKVLDKLTNFANHQGIAVWIESYNYLSLDELLSKISNVKNPCILMLDGIEDPHNLGAILRSVDSTGCQGVIIGKHNQVQLVKQNSGIHMEAMFIATTLNLVLQCLN